MKRNLNKCPMCDEELVVTRYECPKCHTKIEGAFYQSEFGRMTLEQIEFIKTFLIAHGSIKEVEKKLGISYPTVKNRLGEIVEILTGEKDEKSEQLNVLDMIGSGELSVEDALKYLDKE